MHNIEFVPENYVELRDPNDHLISTWPIDCKQKNKRTCIIVECTVPADHMLKPKESEKIDK